MTSAPSSATKESNAPVVRVRVELECTFPIAIVLKADSMSESRARMEADKSLEMFRIGWSCSRL